MDEARLRLAAQNPDGQEGPPWKTSRRVFLGPYANKRAENQIKAGLAGGSETNPESATGLMPILYLIGVIF